MKRIVAILLCLALMLGLNALAEEAEAPETFASGDYKYALLDDGTAMRLRSSATGRFTGAEA